MSRKHSRSDPAGKPEKKPKKSKKKAAPKPGQDWLNTVPIRIHTYPEDGSLWIIPPIRLRRRKRAHD